MAKQAYVYSGTDWVPLASEVTNLSGYYTSAQTDIITAPTGLKLLVPTSVAVGSGTGTASASGTVTFTTVSSVSLNGVFSSTYDNYLILVEVIPATGSQLNFKLRASGTDTSTGYNRQVFLGDDTTSSAGRTTNQTVYDLFATTTSQRTAIEILLYRPNVSGTTGGIVKVSKAYDSSTPVIGIKTFGQTASTQFDGFSLIPASSTITGTVSVYGYTK